jgi:hypothetical protein
MVRLGRDLVTFFFIADKLCWSAPNASLGACKPPLEDGKRMLDRTTLAFLAMAVSRLDRGTLPAA